MYIIDLLKNILSILEYINPIKINKINKNHIGKYTKMSNTE